MPESEFPEELKLNLKRKETLRYGENSHQKAALYVSDDAGPSAATAKKVQGKELSYNNLLDADAAFECVAEFEEPAAVIVKHTNPCGAALANNIREAYERALRTDAVSAFGGIVACNRTFDAGTAEELVKVFLEVVIAPDAEPKALKILSIKPNMRVLLTGGMPDARETVLQIRSIAGGVLVQSRDATIYGSTFEIVSKRKPTEEELQDLNFAFAVAKHIKSNAIVFAKDRATLGIGAGQMSRIDAVRLAAQKAKQSGISLEGSVMASDAFFPFSDSVDAAHEAGATAIIQPGGSKNDQQSIDAANKHGIAMVFTSVRHFRH